MYELDNELYFEQINNAFENSGFSSPNSDPDGSYTGTNPDNPYDEPVQDADDL